MKYGFIPELVGRLPVLVALEDLDEEALVRILVEPRNSLLRQYKKIFSLEGIQMELTDEAVQAVASLALKKGTGARGLRTILEKTRLDLMYEMPSKKGEVAKIVINADVVNGIRLPLIFGKNDEEVA